MADDKKNTDGFRTGFLGDMLRDLQEELGIENKPKGKGRRCRDCWHSVCGWTRMTGRRILLS